MLTKLPRDSDERGSMSLPRLCRCLHSLCQIFGFKVRNLLGNCTCSQVSHPFAYAASTTEPLSSCSSCSSCKRKRAKACSALATSSQKRNKTHNFAKVPHMATNAAGTCGAKSAAAGMALTSEVAYARSAFLPAASSGQPGNPSKNRSTLPFCSLHVPMPF